jgi:hypothetical protein
MKSTTPLTIRCSAWIPEDRLNMHPNEGADLGLMMTKYSMEIDELGRFEVHLLNDCPKESVEIGPKSWERLGKPAKAVLSFDGTVLRIERA